MHERILFVDDDPNILEAYQRKLQHVLHVRTALGPQVGLREVQEKGPFAVVVADMNMPLMNGVEFLKKVREIAPETVRMMLTGNSDIKTAMDAVNEGSVFRFLTKPCPSKLMGDSLVAAIQQYRLITAEKEILEGTLKGTAELLTEILSWISPGIFGRALQLKNAVKMITAKLGMESSWENELAATLCQIGMLAIPSNTLAKALEGLPLTDEEKKSIESVPAISHELLEHIPRMENVAKIILYQNKQYNGNGFPADQVAGKEIPIGSRILKIAADYHELHVAEHSRQDSIKIMLSREGWYDLAVLSVLGSDSSPASVRTESGQSVPIPIKELRAGLTLATPILTKEGQLLVGIGTVITDALLIRLGRYIADNNIKDSIEVLINK